MNQTRRSLVSAIGLLLPFDLGVRAGGPLAAKGLAPVLRFRSFEGAVREAFVDCAGQASPCRRIEVGPCEEVQVGVQGCHNDRPFAGFPAGHLRIVRAGSEPGQICQGVRLYVSTVDIVLTRGEASGTGRPLDFATIPPAPALS